MVSIFFEKAHGRFRVRFQYDGVSYSRLLGEVADQSVDLILTDPPCCDNIACSELSNYFLAWLQAFRLAPGAIARRTALPANLAARSRGEPAVAALRLGLSECFVQMRRVLKDDGRFVFSYQHKTAGAWAALTAALAAGGGRPVQVLPLLDNSTAGLHQHDGTILWDAITVCRKGDQRAVPSDLQVSDCQVTAAVCHTEGSKPAGRLQGCAVRGRRPRQPAARLPSRRRAGRFRDARPRGRATTADRPGRVGRPIELIVEERSPCRRSPSESCPSSSARAANASWPLIYPDIAAFRPQRRAHTMPDPQPPRPGIVQVTEAGEEW